MKLIPLATAALILASGAVSAQTTSAPAPTKPAVTAPAAPAASTAKPKAAAAGPAKAERSAKSLDCSKQADAKTLHGKERKKFRAACMKG